MKCLDCGNPAMLKTVGDHDFGYDRGAPITLRGMTVYYCTCGYTELEIPQLGPMLDTIRTSLSALHAERGQLSFFFTPGVVGIEDGAWGVRVATSRRPMPAPTRTKGCTCLGVCRCGRRQDEALFAPTAGKTKKPRSPKP